MVTLEAMATATPPIASNVDGIPELVTHREDGLLVEPKNSEQLSEAIFELVDDKEMRNRLGTAGRNKVLSSFTREAMVEEYLSLFRAVR
jgi:glycosyltransferase involved in cell wall biosynthesis